MIDRTVHSDLRFLIKNNIPITYVEHKDDGAFCQRFFRICYRTTVEIIFKLEELIDERFCQEIKGKQGALLFDTWNRNPTHYTFMILSYCTLNRNAVTEHFALILGDTYVSTW